MRGIDLMSLKKFCPHRGCTTLIDVDAHRCDTHSMDKQAARKQYDTNRPEWHDMYNSDRWRKARVRYLRDHPLCVECEKRERLVPATVVDHMIDHKGDYALFWDQRNWQGLCVRDHNSKTARTNNKGGNGRD